MIIFSKESEIYNFLKKVVKTEVKTAKILTTITNVDFLAQKGIKFKFTGGYYFVKDETIENSFTVESELFCPLLLSEIEDNGKVEFEFNNGKITIGEFTFEATELETSKTENFENYSTIVFSSEQYKKIEKDFDYTISNFVKTPHTVDSIVIGINNGKVYEVNPGTYLYRLTNFDATIYSVEFEQHYGHRSECYIIPHYYYDLFKGSKNNITIKVFADNVIIYSGNITLKYTPDAMRYELFVNQTKWLSEVSSSIIFKDIKEIVKIADKISRNNYANNEDLEFFVETKDGKAVITSQDVRVEIPFDKEISFGCDSAVLAFLKDKISDDGIIFIPNPDGNYGNRIFIKDGNSLYSFYNVKDF